MRLSFSSCTYMNVDPSEPVKLQETLPTQYREPILILTFLREDREESSTSNPTDNELTTAP
jgi:hypothetical protein